MVGGYRFVSIVTMSSYETYKHSIFFGFHLYRKPEEAIFYSCLSKATALLQQHGYILNSGLVVSDPYIQKARNRLVDQFLKSNASIFIFIADDLEYSPEDMLQLIETPGEIVVGVYSQHCEPAFYPVNIINNSEGSAFTRKDGCISAKHVQTGFMRVNRTVFEQIAKAHPELEYYSMKHNKKVDAAYDFFPQGVYNHQWIGEDYAFCNLWTGLGGKIWVIPNLDLTHWDKGKGYPGNFHEHLMQLPGGCKHKG